MKKDLIVRPGERMVTIIKRGRSLEVIWKEIDELVSKIRRDLQIVRVLVKDIRKSFN